jgi:DNA-directed RNA polymerase subunit D
MEIEVIEHEGNKLRFVIRDSSETFVNVFRRTIIGEVPCLAIEDVILVENSSPILDEILAHKLGLIPLTTPIDEFTITKECENCGGEGCSFCSVPLSLDVEAGKDETRVVYSSDLATDDDKVKPVSDKIPIAKLAPNQKITLEAIAMMGIGNDHAKWSPTATCSFRYYPEVQQDESKCTSCRECIEACPKDLLELKKKTVSLKEPLDCLLCDLCTKACEYDSLKMGQKDNDFIFFLESTGVMKPLEIFKKATEILKEKTTKFEEEYKIALKEYEKKH